MAVKVQAVIGAWQSFNLPTVQRELDEIASELATRQDESEMSRKKLIELSKDFKKTTPEDVRKQVAPLLRNFQSEIDNLNRRSKFAETSFLNVYKKVIDIADPMPTLEYCVGLEKKVGKLADLEIENKNLRETLHDYNEEFKEVRNQDVTIKALKEKIKSYEEQQDSTIQTKIKELEKELTRQYTEKERVLQETQETITRRLNEAENRAQTLQGLYHQTQSELFELKSKHDETSVAKADEAVLLMEDLERANQRATLAEKEVISLKEQLDKMSTNMRDQLDSINNSGSEIEPTADSLARSSLEIELATKDKELSQLVNDLQGLQATLHSLKESSSAQVQSLEDQLVEVSGENEKLKSKLFAQKDYEEVKRELGIMKSVEFGLSSSKEDTAPGGVVTSKPLEVMLLEKNKALQNENTTHKQAVQDLSKKATESEQELLSLKSLVTEQKCLITQLESDLTSVHSLSTMYRGEGEGSPSIPELVAEAVRESTSSSPTPAVVAPSPAHGGAPPDFSSAAESLLPIVSAQRERFRQRNDELEGDIMFKSQQVVLLQNELDSLRADNLKLYEKIRFLQSYQGRHTSTDTATESRYSSQYEETLDPFASFSRKERLRRYSSLSPFEKVILSMGRFILGNKTARTVMFMYTALVHCLVFLVLYKLAHTESCKRDVVTNCAEKFAEHMQSVHGLNDFHG
ncbi:protein CASP-like isoform X5 [Oratosquilla oratoria]|uniref:protein CASP-like isoform X5 n=1 Tax=Oratosquilla oratoria TaxID=337810 RepID=UPI003F760838